MVLTYPLVSISSRLQVQKNDASKDAYKVSFETIVTLMMKLIISHRIPSMPFSRFLLKKDPRVYTRKYHNRIIFVFQLMSIV